MLVSSSTYVWTQLFRKAVMLNDFDIDMVMGVQKRQGHKIYILLKKPIIQDYTTQL